MKVRELIAELQKCPPEMEATVWSHEDDEYMPVVEALHEYGCSEIVLLTHPSGAIPCPPSWKEE